MIPAHPAEKHSPELSNIHKGTLWVNPRPQINPSSAEVGVYGADGWIDTHGFTEPPKLPDNISNSLKGHVVQELRGRGAKAPADRRRLVAEFALMPLTIEEFLRAYAPVTMAREVVKDTTIGGCPITPGNMLLLSVPAANRDPAMYPDADKVIVDRKENRHAAFGLGIHRCVGSNLARMEMTVAVEEFLKRIPEFCLDLSQAVTRSEGTVRGPRNLPLIIG
jgi:hypothetical protein